MNDARLVFGLRTGESPESGLRNCRKASAVLPKERFHATCQGASHRFDIRQKL
jgi:hypothetical protein